MAQNHNKGRSSSTRSTEYRKRSNQSSGKKRTSAKSSGRNTKKAEEQIPEYTDEIILILTLTLSIILVICNFNLAGGVSKAVKPALFGIMGTLAYIFPFVLFIGVAFYISNRGSRLAKRKLISSVALYIVLIALLQQISNSDNSAMKMVDFYKASAESKSGGGVVGGLICMLLNKAFGTPITYVILIGTLLVLFVLLTGKLLVSGMGKKINESYTSIEERRVQARNEAPVCDEDGVIITKRKAKTFTFAKSGGNTIVEPLQADLAASSLDNLPIQRSVEVSDSEEEVFEKELQEKFNKNKDYDISALADGQMMDNGVAVESLTEASEQPASVVEDNMDGIVKAASDGTQHNTQANKQPSHTNEKAGSDNLEIHIEKPVEKKYQFPPVDLLSKSKGGAKGMTDGELKETAAKLQKTLESFGVRVTITNVSCGPAVTRYELQPEQGVKVSRITNLADDIKLNLAAADVRIEAPIPGKAAVGIEVPNKENIAVKLRDLIESEEFKKHPSDIAFAVGKDIGGQTIVTDIAKMPHLLIAGATGSGKSVCINTLIMSILYKANPADVRLIMVDPKVVELSVYNGIPHLLIPVVTDPKKASAALNWAVMEMTDRYQKFAELGVRDIKGYNEKVAKVADLEDNKYQKMPQIVIIVDELADLMMVAPGEVEDAICRLAQMARAAGLHLIIATQRPSVNVITGLIKANVPSRIAFSVSSAIDSRTIIDGSGAEKLLGKGDMLFFPSGYPKPVRVQGAFVSDKEVSSVVEFLTSKNENHQYNEEISSKIASGVTSEVTSASASDRDDYFVEAGKFIIEKDKASIGMLQRVYKIGFNRAARIMDQLSDAGVVGPEEGTKPRKVLMSLEEFEQFVDEYV